MGLAAAGPTKDDRKPSELLRAPPGSPSPSRGLALSRAAMTTAASVSPKPSKYCRAGAAGRGAGRAPDRTAPGAQDARSRSVWGARPCGHAQREAVLVGGWGTGAATGQPLAAATTLRSAGAAGLGDKFWVFFL